MLNVAVKYVPEKKWGHLETLLGHLETDLGHLETVWGTMRQRLKVPHPD